MNSTDTDESNHCGLCTYHGSKVQLAKHWRHCHQPQEITDDLLLGVGAKRCQGCSLGFLDLPQHLSRKTCNFDAQVLVQKCVSKEFDNGWFTGLIESTDGKLCAIRYADGDTENISKHLALQLVHNSLECTRHEPGLAHMLSDSEPDADVSLLSLLDDNDDSSDDEDPSSDFDEKCVIEDLEHRKLPDFTPMSTEAFKWGDVDGTDFIRSISSVYERMPSCRKNIFLLPTGKCGQTFIKEKARLIECWTTHNVLERIALKAVAVMDFLLLQRTHHKAKTKDNKEALSRRILDWKAGNIEKLFSEVCAIHGELDKRRSRMSTPQLSATFAKLIFAGRVNAALRLLKDQVSAGPQVLTDEVLQTLEKLHPDSSEPIPEIMQTGPFPEVHPVIFESITAVSIKRAAMKTRGSGGVSGMDAESMQRQLHSFGDASLALAEAMAAMAKRLCTDFVDPDGLEAFVANRLIPLDKNPGTRPIGIGEVLRRVIGKAIMTEIRHRVADYVGVLNLAAGQKAGVEAIIHAMTKMFGADETDAVLLVDGSNAFNRLNRKATLHNTRYNCPPISIVLINLYRQRARLFVRGGHELASAEGTTQGCSFGMAMYALGVLPLIQNLWSTLDSPEHEHEHEHKHEHEHEHEHEAEPEHEHKHDLEEEPESVDVLGEGGEGDQQSHKLRKFIQAWYADDAQAGGCLLELRRWWDVLVRCGPAFGYFPQPSKTYLVVKQNKLEEAKEIFKGTGVKIANGRRDLGAALGEDVFLDEYIKKLVREWVQELETLSEIARSQPHAAYAAFTHGLQHKWSFAQRTMQMSDHLAPVEEAIRNKFLPALFGEDCPFNDNLRNLLALPCRHGGLGIWNPVVDAKFRLADSRLLSLELQEKILSMESELNFDSSVHSAKITQIKERWEKRFEKRVVRVISVDHTLKRIIEFAAEKGASNIFSTLPFEKYGFAFKAKRDFRDLLCLRYHRPVRGLPSLCVCGANYSLDHSQMCKRGGFIHMRHDEPKNLLARETGKIFHDVQCEPPLMPLTGEAMRLKSAIVSDDARSDVRVRGFWSNMRNAFFEFRVFYPHARSYQDQSPLRTYNLLEKSRKREYEQRIRDIEDGDFTPMIMSSSGGMGPGMSVALKHLAKKIADKRKESYAMVVNVLRCKFAFAVARAALVCLRGSRGRWPMRAAIDPLNEINVASAELCS
jgi:hypothetical protein